MKTITVTALVAACLTIDQAQALYFQRPFVDWRKPTPPIEPVIALLPAMEVASFEEPHKNKKVFNGPNEPVFSVPVGISENDDDLPKRHHHEILPETQDDAGFLAYRPPVVEWKKQTPPIEPVIAPLPAMEFN